MQPQLSIGSAFTQGDLYDYTYSSQEISKGKDKLYISGGATAGYMFNNHFGLYAGLAYSSFTWQSRVVDYSAGEAFLSNINQTYVQVPLYLRYVSSRPGKVGFLGTFGPRFSFLTGAKETDIANGTSQTFSDKSGFNSAVVAIGLGLGVNIPCTKNISLDLLLDSQATTPIFKDGAPDQQLEASGLLIALDVAL